MFRAPWPWRAVRDQWDDHWAVRRRAVLARRRWLVSWTRREDGSWLARVSAPELPVTIERAGKSRRLAIQRATKYLAELTRDEAAT